MELVFTLPAVEVTIKEESESILKLSSSIVMTIPWVGWVEDGFCTLFTLNSNVSDSW